MCFCSCVHLRTVSTLSALSFAVEHGDSQVNSVQAPTPEGNHCSSTMWFVNVNGLLLMIDVLGLESRQVVMLLGIYSVCKMVMFASLLCIKEALLMFLLSQVHELVASLRMTIVI